MSKPTTAAGLIFSHEKKGEPRLKLGEESVPGTIFDSTRPGSIDSTGLSSPRPSTDDQTYT